MARTENRDKDHVLVYSSEYGRTCPECHKTLKKCTCEAKKAVSKNDGKVRVARETKGRKGKGVTVISGLALDESEIRELAKALKTSCSAGGTVKDGKIEIQGDHRERVITELRRRGFTVAGSG